MMTGYPASIWELITDTKPLSLRQSQVLLNPIHRGRQERTRSYRHPVEGYVQRTIPLVHMVKRSHSPVRAI